MGMIINKVSDNKAEICIDYPLKQNNNYLNELRFTKHTRI